MFTATLSNKGNQTIWFSKSNCHTLPYLILREGSISKFPEKITSISIYYRVLCSWFHTPTFGVRNSILNWVSKTQSLKRKKGKRYLKFHKAFLICNNFLKINFMFLVVSRSMKTLCFHTFEDLWCCMMHVMC